MISTTADLLAAIKRRSFMPTGSTTFSDTELLAVADEIVETRLLTKLLAIREEYLVFSDDQDITADQQAYDVPARAVAMKLREAKRINGTTIENLTRMEPEQATSTATGTPSSFYLQDDQVCLYPIPDTTTATLRISYFLRPAKLVAASSAAVISAIDTGTNIVTVSSIPSAWATGDVFDLTRQDGGQRPLAIDLTSTLVSGSAITLPSLPTGLRVGDYVSIAGESALVQLPQDWRPALAQGVAAQILGDMNLDGADKAEAKFTAMLAELQALSTPRVEGEDRLISPVNWF